MARLNGDTQPPSERPDDRYGHTAQKPSGNRSYPFAVRPPGNGPGSLRNLRGSQENCYNKEEVQK